MQPLMLKALGVCPDHLVWQTEDMKNTVCNLCGVVQRARVVPLFGHSRQIGSWDAVAWRHRLPSRPQTASSRWQKDVLVKDGPQAVTHQLKMTAGKPLDLIPPRKCRLLSSDGRFPFLVWGWELAGSPGVFLRCR